MSKLFNRRKLLNLGLAVAVLSFGTVVFAGEQIYVIDRGCYIDKPCDYRNQGPNTGLCNFDGSGGGNGACVCAEIAGPQGTQGTCFCSTGQYPPC